MDNIITYIIMIAVMVFISGPDMILLVKNTISHGKKAGLYTVLGMAMGLSFWTLIAVLGLSMAIAQSAVIFTAIKYLGAAYLLFLGVRSFFSKNSISLEAIQENPSDSLMKSSNQHYKDSFTQALLSNIFNPKTVLVYITIMPQFIDLTGSVNQQLIVLGLIATVIAVVWFLVIIHLIDLSRKWLGNSKFLTAFQKSTGVLLASFGVRTAL